MFKTRNSLVSPQTPPNCKAIPTFSNTFNKVNNEGKYGMIKKKKKQIKKDKAQIKKKSCLFKFFQ